jgi:hypothetical protein
MVILADAQSNHGLRAVVQEHRDSILPSDDCADKSEQRSLWLCNVLRNPNRARGMADSTLLEAGGTIRRLVAPGPRSRS